MQCHSQNGWKWAFVFIIVTRKLIGNLLSNWNVSQRPPSAWIIDDDDVDCCSRNVVFLSSSHFDEKLLFQMLPRSYLITGSANIIKIRIPEFINKHRNTTPEFVQLPSKCRSTLQIQMSAYSYADDHRRSQRHHVINRAVNIVNNRSIQYLVNRDSRPKRSTSNLCQWMTSLIPKTSPDVSRDAIGHV